MNLTLNKTIVKERVYVVRWASKLLLGIPAIRGLGLTYEIPGTYTVKAVDNRPDHHPLRSGIKEHIVKQYPTPKPFVCLFLGTTTYEESAEGD